MMEPTFKKTVDLIYAAKKLGIDFVLNEDKLQLKFPGGQKIDKDFLDEIREHKQEIIDFLKNESWRAGQPAIADNKVHGFNRDVINHIPLSFSQERLWFIDRLEGSVKYHSLLALRLNGTLNTDALEFALRTVIMRHEVLRSVYYELDGTVYQKVQPADGWKMGLADGSRFVNDNTALLQYIDGLNKQPFNLAADYMLRAQVLRLQPQQHILVMVLHHIACDGWSLPIVVNEVKELYASFVAGASPNLPALPLQFADYAVWERQALREENIASKIQYWKNKLAGLEPLALPYDAERVAGKPVKSGTVFYKIDKPLVEKVKQLSLRFDASLYMTLLATFNALLYRYCNQTDITIGTSVANRNQHEIEELIGFFVNTLALRNRVEPGLPFSSLLRQVKETMLEAYRHQEVPYEKVVEAVLTGREQTRSGLFQAMLVLINTPSAQEIKLGGLEILHGPTPINEAKFDCSFFVNENPNGFSISIEYNASLFREETIRRMATHFERLLETVTGNAEVAVAKLPMLTDAEKEQLVNHFGRSQSHVPGNTTFISLFEQHAAQHPQKTALLHHGSALSYGQLNAQANQLAHLLTSKGVEPGHRVALWLHAGTNMVAAMLGVMKAGAAYVPIDTSFPAERVQYMLHNSGARLVIAHPAFWNMVGAMPAPPEVIVPGDDTLQHLPHNNPGQPVQPGFPAYVMYTSGSTGRPKGVMVSQANVADYLLGLQAAIPIDQCQSFALLSSYATDLGNTVLFGALAFGGTLHLFDKDTLSDAYAMVQYFERHAVDCIKIVPSHWRALEADGRYVLPKKLLIFGGEALSKPVVNLVQASGAGCTIVNHYGPTETTIGKLVHVVEENYPYGTYIPVGRPFGNTSVYVVNKEGQLCPQGVPGHLLIGGAGVANGYLDNPHLSAEKFTANPICNTGGRVYHTGDLVRFLTDGNLLYLNRADDQVKIRGYRVELGEIEKALLELEGVQQAIVLAKTTGDTKTLKAFVIATGTFDESQLHAALQHRLPDYMVPSQVLALDSFPLTANGKIDRKALLALEKGGGDKLKMVPPANDTEEKLAAIWAEVLEVDSMSMLDNFFEKGGHSLLAIRLISAIRKTFGVEMPIGHVFDYPTLRQLAEQIHEVPQGETLPPIRPVQPRPNCIPLSYSQERLWIIDQLNGSREYHIPTVLRIQGAINPTAIGNAFRKVVRRHEALRTVIKTVDDKPCQHIMDAQNWQLAVETVNEEAALPAFIAAEVDQPFNLAKDYMVRAKLLMMPGNQAVLVMTLHHIASDGWSAPILVQELAEVYNATAENRSSPLENLPIQYADYAIWQRAQAGTESWNAKIEYWKNQLQNVARLDVPADYTRPKVNTNKGAFVTLQVPAPLAAAMHQYSSGQGVSLFMTALAGFNILLHKYCHQTDICIGTPVAGRQAKETEGLIGFFVNTLAIRNQVTPAMLWSQLVAQVKQQVLEAYAHQEIPFEKVVETVVKERDASKNPLFQVVFSYQNLQGAKQPALTGLQLLPAAGGQPGHTTSKFDLTFNLIENDAGLFVTAEYYSDIFKEDTIRRWAANYLFLLQQAMEQQQATVGALVAIAPAEKALLDGFSTTQPIDTSASLAQLFEKQVALHANKHAVVLGGQHTTYAELNQQANRIAVMLNANGVQPGDAVALFMPRGVEMIAAILGTLKLGCTYVPLNIGFPAGRLNYIIENAGCRAILYGQPLPQHLTEQPTRLAVEQATGYPHTFQTVNWMSDTPVYIMYTSGTTGKPKGIAVHYSNVINLVFNQGSIQVVHTDRVLQWSNYGFDGSVYDIFGALLNGATLCMLPEGAQADAGAMLQTIAGQQVTVAFVTTAIFNSLVDAGVQQLAGMRRLLFGGEAASPLHVKQCLQFLGDGKLINMYGPTETTVYSTYCPLFTVEDNVAIPIGRALTNVQLMVLNQQLQPVPLGSAGELFIAGAGVSMGYVGNAALTAEKFVQVDAGHGKLRAYRTGDRVRWRADGMLEFLGRIDDQVKIRGYRIEPAEIEQVLQEHPQVRQAVIKVLEQDGYKTLCAYIKPAAAYDQQVVKSWLQTQVPGYMVPPFWVTVQQFELNASGKIDKHALPNPERQTQASGANTGPRNEVEAALADIWKNALGIEQIGIFDNFFELGGDSILTLQVVNAARRRGIDLQPRDLFIHQTIDQLAVSLQNQAAGKVVGEQGLLTGECGLLPIQQWYLQQPHSNVSHFNQALIFGFKKTVTPRLLQQACNILIAHHDALRFTYSKTADGWRQYYGQHITQVVTDTIAARDEQAMQKEITEKSNRYQQSLDIFAGEIMKVVLFETPSFERENRLLLVIHHLAVDGVSWRILLENIEFVLTALSNNQQPDLGKKGSSYRQWYQSLVHYGQQQFVKEQAAYWQQVVGRFVPVKQKSIAQQVRLKDMKTQVFQVGERQTDNLLHQVPRAFQTEINDVLLTALAASLKTWGQLDYVTVGLEGHGRMEIDDNVDSSNTVGWFTNIYPVVLDARSAGSPTELLVSVKEQLRLIPGKGLGYGVLKYINKDQRLAAEPRWNVVFNYLGQLDTVVQSGKWISAAKESAGRSMGDDHLVNEDLVVNCSITNGKLQVLVSFNTKNYTDAEVHELVTLFQFNIEMLINLCADLVKQGIVTAQEAEVPKSRAVLSKSKNKYLIPIKPTGNKPPLYIIAGGGGTAHKFMRFAKMLDEEQPVYAIQPPIDYKDLKQFPDTIEAIAGEFINELLTNNPDGPFALSGHCTGGKIALEMAQQLKSAGKPVIMLAMFDTLVGKRQVDMPPPAHFLLRIPQSARRLLSRVVLKLDFEMFLLRNHTKKAIAYKMGSLKNFVSAHFGRGSAERTELNETEIFEKTSNLYTSASRRYNINHYPDEIVVFYAQERYYFVDVNNKINFKRIALDNSIKYSWRDYAASVVLYEVKGDHSDIFEAVHGNEFAMLVQQHLDNGAARLQHAG